MQRVKKTMLKELTKGLMLNQRKATQQTINKAIARAIT
jgi:hypothetical protein